jgi:hypothetical protein
MEKKWEAVASDLNKLPALSSLKGKVAEKKFKRMWADCDKKYAISQEGANLSGLPEVADQIDKVLYNMIVEVAKTKQVKDEQTAKEKRREKTMMEHEKMILSKHDVITSMKTPNNSMQRVAETSYSSTTTSCSSLAKEDAHLADIIIAGGATVVDNNDDDVFCCDEDKENDVKGAVVTNNNNNKKKKKRNNSEEIMSSDPEKFFKSMSSLFQTDAMMIEQRVMDAELERDRKRLMLTLELEERRKKMENETRLSDAMSNMGDAMKKFSDIVSYFIAKDNNNK